MWGRRRQGGRFSTISVVDRRRSGNEPDRELRPGRMGRQHRHLGRAACKVLVSLRPTIWRRRPRADVQLARAACRLVDDELRRFFCSATPPSRGRDPGGIQEAFRDGGVTPLQRTRLEKAAADCGFDLTPELQGDLLVLRSAQFPESITVEPLSETAFALGDDSGLLLTVPKESAERFRVDGYDALYGALERAAATARTLPNRVSARFKKAVATLPRSTEAHSNPACSRSSYRP